MKKYLITIIVAILIGVSLGIIFFKKFDSNIEVLASNMNNQVYAIQIGVYKNIDNANKISEEYNGVIVKDEDIYRVYIDIVKNKELLNIMKKYYENKGISYYLKSINISSEFNEVLDDYELLLLESNENSYSAINKNICKEFLQYEYQN